LDIFTLATQQHIPTAEIADRMAERILTGTPSGGVL